MTTSPTSSADMAGVNQQFVNWTSDQARAHLLLDLARRYKGMDPEIDARIDKHAEQISGRAGIKMIAPMVPGEPRVPFYMEGEPGVGKTTLIRAAIKDFCAIAGLNFVENPEDGYKFGPKDFYYCTVNLSGKTNTMDIGGLPSKGELETRSGVESRRRATNASAWLFDEMVSSARMGCAMTGLEFQEGPPYINGDLESIDIKLLASDDNAGSLDLVVNKLLNSLSAGIKEKHGVGINMLKEGETPVDGRLYLSVKKGAKGVRITATAPIRMEADAEYVAEMLPNRRFAMANKARFALFNFDDVANASESVRNVLLEVAQSNRYSGVMDIGNAYVSFTGNMGAEDGTNTQSEQSNAEVTRVFKVRVRDTPRDWARRTVEKYAETGDCYMGAFISKFGNDSGIFRETGDISERGVPRPNSRSLENMLAKILPYFIMAKASGVSPTVFGDDIEHVSKGTAGANVAQRYIGFMRGMLTEAVPLADALMATGKLDKERFERSMGSNTRTAEADFAFRFATALADAFVERVAFSQDAIKAHGNKDKVFDLVTESTERLCTGLALLDPGQMNYALSTMMTRISAVQKMADTVEGTRVKMSADTTNAMSKGFVLSVKNGVWRDPEQAQNDFVRMICGGDVKPPSRKARAGA